MKQAILPIPLKIAKTLALNGFAASLAFVANPAQAANLISNGSFENSSSNIGDNGSLSNGSTTLTNWVVTNEIDYLGSYWSASNGSRSLDLNGSSAGGIQQTFTTTIGATYNVSFDLAGNPDNAILKQLEVSAGSYSQNFSFDNSGKSTTNMGWLTKNFSFVANSSSTTLQFSSLIGGSWGPALDNVIVSSAVPEPLTILGAVTAAGFGAGFKRKLAKSKKD
jgi:choice-of-anchor C domain-containing protein